jgi:hypothetical protein
MDIGRTRSSSRGEIAENRIIEELVEDVGWLRAGVAYLINTPKIFPILTAAPHNIQQRQPVASRPTFLFQPATTFTT